MQYALGSIVPHWPLGGQIELGITQSILYIWDYVEADVHFLFYISAKSASQAQIGHYLVPTYPPSRTATAMVPGMLNS